MMEYVNSVHKGSTKEEIADGSDVRVMVIEVFAASMAVVEMGLEGDEFSVGEMYSVAIFAGVSCNIHSVV